MKVKNNYTSHLGFGTERILPGETKPLPNGYNETHPVVKFYISKKWLEIVNDNNGSASTTVNTDACSDNGNAGKALDRMNKEELQALASARGIDVAETDTKQVIIDKLKAAQTNNA